MFSFSDIPYSYENSYGSYAGYFGMDPSGLTLRINFLLSGSDSIESVDVYLDGLSDSPSYTIDTSGLNIIQVVNVITEALIEDGEVPEDVLQERGDFTSPQGIQYILEDWVKSNKSILNIIQKNAVPEIFNTEWADFVSGKPNYKNIKYYVFAQALKQFLFSKGLTNKTYRKRKNGSKEREIQDPSLAAQFESVLESMSWQDKFELLRGSIKAVVDNDIQALFLFGDPGSGKSFTTIEELNKLHVEYKLYKGSIKDTDTLIRILYNNRDNSLLVFDDCDAMLKVKDSANLLKAALENVPVRTITYADVGHGKSMNDIPQKFDFTSGILFISNERKLNSAVASRALTLEITLSNTKILDKIEQTLKEYRPDISITLKKQALDYLYEISSGVKTVDYRTLEKVLIAMKIQPNNWKKAALMFIKALD